MSSDLMIGDHTFKPLPSVALMEASAWGLMRWRVNYLFTHDKGASDGEWFGASRCVRGGRTQTIAFSKDRSAVETALIEQIARDAP
jgi:hypothetical protein